MVNLVKLGLYKIVRNNHFHVKNGNGFHVYCHKNEGNYILVLGCKNEVPGYPVGVVLDVWYPAYSVSGKLLMHLDTWDEITKGI